MIDHTCSGLCVEGGGGSSVCVSVCAVCIVITVSEGAYTGQLTLKPPHGDHIDSTKCLCVRKDRDLHWWSKPPKRQRRRELQSKMRNKRAEKVGMKEIH